MSHNEIERVDELSGWYLNEQLDFDKRMIEFRYKALKPKLRPGCGLELGSAEGEMTRFLVNDFQELTVVDGAGDLLERIPEYSNVIKVCSLFEAFEPARNFDTIIMEHILEHVDDPVALLKRSKQWLAPGGVLIVGVPNANSIHRLVAVKMGLLPTPCSLNARDRALGHRRVYTHETLRKDLEESELNIVETGGVFFKPLSNAQIQENWNEEMINGFYELGKDFPELAAEIYAVCTVSS